ncbi:MAG TPA: hypothetical protein DCE23_01545, partial [Firmicutes bacterium]|nr:hypothetical protein [Bacillota bacterium]
AVMLFITLIFTTYLSYCNYSFEDIYIDDIVDYMLDNYDKDDIKLYVEFNNGAYAEYMGIKSYIDTRAELFLKNSNGKDDIFDESIHIFENDKFFDYDAFVNKYGFTHILVNMYINSNFDEYLQSNDKYEVVYEQHFDDTSDSFVMRKLYALKEG